MAENQLKLLEQYVDSTLGEQDIPELRKLLLEDPEARAKLRTLATVEFGLQDLAAGAELSESGLSFSNKKRFETKQELTKTIAHSWWKYSLIATFTAVAASIVWTIIGLGVVTEAHQPNAIAHISYQSKAHWSIQREMGAAIAKEKLTLESGLAKLDFSNGTCVTLEGPAIFEIIGPNQTLLHSGVLTAQVPQSAIGFRVDTPVIEVIDRGTAFGISVSDIGLTNVSVFEGEIEVNSKHRDSNGTSLQRVVEGQAIRAVNDSAVLESIEIQTQPFKQVWPINSGVLQATGAMKFVSPGPTFVPGRYEDLEHILVFPERRDVWLEEPLEVDLIDPGEYVRFQHQPPITVAAGQRIRSYLLQLNRGTAEGNVIGQITFDRPILGLVLSNKKLNGTDASLGNPKGIYSGRKRGIEPPKRIIKPGKPDTVILTPDRQTLSLNLGKGYEADQIRVIVNDFEAIP